MQHRVTNHLVLRASSAGTKEWSRSISIGQDNSAMFEVILRSHSTASVPTVTAKLMGSNDLEKWAFITQMTLATIPIHKKLDGLGNIPYEYLRVGYVATHATLTPNVSIAATITTSKKAG